MIFGKKKKDPDSMPVKVDTSRDAGTSVNALENTKEGSTTMWGNKGNSLVESSMYAEAIKCYDRALEINPKLMEVLNNKGLALARTGRLGEAIECYNKALELRPDDPEVVYNKGIALAQLGKLAESVDCYDKILAKNPDDSDAWCSKGDVLFQSGKLYEEALHAYDKSIEINPEDETPWNNRGMTLVKLNRYEEAIESYDKALEINPKLEKIWSNKGFAIAKMRETQEKIDLQKLAIAIPKDERNAPNIQEIADETQIKHEIEPDPSTSAPSPAFFSPEEPSESSETDVIDRRAIESKKEESTVENLSIPYQKEKGKTSENYLILGNIKYSSRKYEEALGYFNISLEIDPDNGTAWNNKGLALGKLEKIDEAIKCYDKALEINPEDHVALNNKGSIFYKKRKINEAMQCYKSALQLKADSKTAIRGMEICLASLNKSKRQ